MNRIIIVLLLLVKISFGQLLFSDERLIVDGNSNNPINPIHPAHLKFADISGNGYNDIVFASTSSYTNPQSNLSWCRNNGNGTFSSPVSIWSGFAIQYDYGDLDNDGDIDIVTTLFETGEVRLVWFENIGNGNFGAYQVLQNNVSLNDPKVCDFDQDNDLDIVYSRGGTNYGEFEWIENDSLNGFLSPQQLFVDTGFEYNVGFIEDSDGDGDVDIVVSGFNSLYLSRKEIRYYENDNGTFLPPTWVEDSLWNYTQSLKFVDLNGNGLADVLCNVASTQNVLWYENLGSGNFGPQQIVGTGSFPFDATAADFDNDNDNDVVYGSDYSNRISLFENLGGGTFNSQEQQTGTFNTAYAWTVYATDLNNDNLKDIVAATFDAGDFIYWFENLSGFANISGNTFYDVNINGILDSGDLPLATFGTTVQPNNVWAHSNEVGNYVHNVDSGLHLLGYVPHPNWQLSSDSTEFHLTVDSNSIISGLNFGFTPINDVTDLELIVSSGQTRCNSLVQFEVGARNYGTTFLDGVLWLELDTFIQSVSFISQPDTIINQDLFGWEFSNLSPSQVVTRQLVLEIPGINNGFVLGNTLNLNVHAITNDVNGIDTFNHIYTPTVFCAYDPNDKLTNPDRPGAENYTYHDESIIYTIRFQNTGNDTAFNVVVRDTLDANIDPESLSVISSSHMDVLETEVLQNEFIKFSFDNIMLPDSNVSILESQGYVSFRVKANQGLVDSTVVNNSASIYFDSNPPIVTNTTVNTLISIIPCEPNIQSQNVVQCDSALIGGSWLYTSQVVRDTFQNTNGCDSIMEYLVDINYSLEWSVFDTIMEGESYNLPFGGAVDQAGVYYDTLQSSDFCDSVVVVNLFIANSVGVHGANESYNWNIFPNPTNDNLTFKNSNSINHSIYLELVNSIGLQMHYSEVTEATATINVQSWNEGLYIVRVVSQDGSTLGTRKFVILR